MKKIISILAIILILSMFIGVIKVNAADEGVTEIITAMEGTSEAIGAGSHGTAKIINNVIGLLQVAGTGISITVITLLGIKYILASPGEKADIKKTAIPIGIGCILLFGAVNLMAAVEEFSNTVLK